MSGNYGKHRGRHKSDRQFLCMSDSKDLGSSSVRSDDSTAAQSGSSTHAKYGINQLDSRFEPYVSAICNILSRDDSARLMIVMVGMSGSGKSTVVQQILARVRHSLSSVTAEIFSLDNYRVRVNDGIYPATQQEHRRVNALAVPLYEEELLRSPARIVIVDNMNLRWKPNWDLPIEKARNDRMYLLTMTPGLDDSMFMCSRSTHNVVGKLFFEIAAAWPGYRFSRFINKIIAPSHVLKVVQPLRRDPPSGFQLFKPFPPLPLHSDHRDLAAHFSKSTFGSLFVTGGYLGFIDNTMTQAALKAAEFMSQNGRAELFMRRDGLIHMTLIAPSSKSDKDILKFVANEILSMSVPISEYTGVARIQHGKDETWFLTLSNRSQKMWRETVEIAIERVKRSVQAVSNAEWLVPNPAGMHVTIGFHESDIHGVNKAIPPLFEFEQEVSSDNIADKPFSGKVFVLPFRGFVPEESAPEMPQSSAIRRSSRDTIEEPILDGDPLYPSEAISKPRSSLNESPGRNTPSPSLTRPGSSLKESSEVDTPSPLRRPGSSLKASPERDTPSPNFSSSGRSSDIDDEMSNLSTVTVEQDIPELSDRLHKITNNSTLQWDVQPCHLSNIAWLMHHRNVRHKFRDMPLSISLLASALTSHPSSSPHPLPQDTNLRHHRRYLLLGFQVVARRGLTIDEEIYKRSKRLQLTVPRGLAYVFEIRRLSTPSTASGVSKVTLLGLIYPTSKFFGDNDLQGEVEIANDDEISTAVGAGSVRTETEKANGEMFTFSVVAYDEQRSEYITVAGSKNNKFIFPIRAGDSDRDADSTLAHQQMIREYLKTECGEKEAEKYKPEDYDNSNQEWITRNVWIEMIEYMYSILLSKLNISSRLAFLKRLYDRHETLCGEFESYLHQHILPFAHGYRNIKFFALTSYDEKGFPVDKSVAETFNDQRWISDVGFDIVKTRDVDPSIDTIDYRRQIWRRSGEEGVVMLVFMDGVVHRRIKMKTEWYVVHRGIRERLRKFLLGKSSPTKLNFKQIERELMSAVDKKLKIFPMPDMAEAKVRWNNYVRALVQIMELYIEKNGRDALVREYQFRYPMIIKAAEKLQEMNSAQRSNIQQPGAF